MARRVEMSCRALVTGASGFIGAHVARTLAAAGLPLRLLRRPGGSDLGSLLDELPDAEEAVGDLCDGPSLTRALDGCRLLFHVGACYSLRWADRYAVHATNVEGTRGLRAAALARGVQRVVYTSSVATIGLRRDGRPSTEQELAQPEQLVGAYKRSKWQAEQVAREFCARGLELVIVNPSTPVGWGDRKPTPTGAILLDFLRGRMPAYVDTALNFIDVEDVAAGHLLALERGRPGERYILGHRNMSLAELFAALQQLTGIPAPRVQIPHWVALAASAVDEFVLAPLLGRPPVTPLAGALMARQRMLYDPTRAVSELGLPQTPVEQALQKAVRWFSQNGYLDGVRQDHKEACP